MFDNRTYRKHHRKKGLVSFDITVKETNLNIQADKDLSDLAVSSVLEIRNILENYISQFPDFATSMVPYRETVPTPGVIDKMIESGRLANVGPMAAVAGTVAEFSGQQLLKHSNQILVENGGDIFVKSDSDTIFCLYAGDSPFSMTTGIKIKKKAYSYGICTSSGTIGHSKSFGKADAVTVLSDSCPLADAVATSLGNRITAAADIEKAIKTGKKIPGVSGIVIVLKDNIGAWGDLELVSLQ